MEGTASKKPILTVCATTSNRLKDLAISDGKLIFIQDKGRIALDFGGKRVFYNQIIELDTEQDRLHLETPVAGGYYFIIDTAVLWTYQSRWIQITLPPEEVIFVGTELPELGSKNKLYINKKNNNISIWDEEIHGYKIVGEKTNSIPTIDIENLFK
jgi:hypothetical protein